jgi:hypothetical protein
VVLRGGGDRICGESEGESSKNEPRFPLPPFSSTSDRLPSNGVSKDGKYGFGVPFAAGRGVKACAYAAADPGVMYEGVWAVLSSTGMSDNVCMDTVVCALEPRDLRLADRAERRRGPGCLSPEESDFALPPRDMGGLPPPRDMGGLLGDADALSPRGCWLACRGGDRVGDTCLREDRFECTRLVTLRIFRAPREPGRLVRADKETLADRGCGFLNCARRGANLSTVDWTPEPRMDTSLLVLGPLGVLGKELARGGCGTTFTRSSGSTRRCVAALRGVGDTMYGGASTRCPGCGIVVLLPWLARLD